MTSSSKKTGKDKAPERLRVCGRGGAGNMHPPSEIKALDEEECRLTAELAKAHSIDSTSAVKTTKYSRRRTSSVFSHHSQSSKGSSQKSNTSFIRRFLASARRSSSTTAERRATAPLSGIPSESAPSTTSGE